MGSAGRSESYDEKTHVVGTMFMSYDACTACSHHYFPIQDDDEIQTGRRKRVTEFVKSQEWQHCELIHMIDSQIECTQNESRVQMTQQPSLNGLIEGRSVKSLVEIECSFVSLASIKTQSVSLSALPFSVIRLKGSFYQSPRHTTAVVRSRS